METIVQLIAIVSFVYMLLWGRQSVVEILGERRRRKQAGKHRSNDEHDVQVFLSYSRKDLKFVERLAWDLKAAGLGVWYDLTGLQVGSRWGTEIQTALRASQHFVVILSPNSVVSEWVERELLFARKLGLKIAPVLCQDCDLPLWAIDLQYINMQGGSYETNLPKLVQALGVGAAVSPQGGALSPSEVGSPAGAARLPATVSVTRKATPARRYRVRTAAMLAVSLTLLLSFGWLVLPKPRLSEPATFTPEPTAPSLYSLYDGEWRGITSQQHELAFTISDNVLSLLSGSIAVESKRAGCLSHLEGLVAVPITQPLDGQAFSAEWQSDEMTLSVAGRFEDADTGSGSLVYESRDWCTYTASTNWTAAR